jgi:protein-tyrosine-phosphatase
VTLILFVCRGNTCRSPLAEAWGNHLARSLGLASELKFASAGVSPTLGAPASPGSLACAAAAGLDLRQHRARAATGALLLAADCILALDKRVRADLMDSAPEAVGAHIAPLVSFAPDLGLAEIADPWGGTAADYDLAFRHIQAAVDGLVARLRTR